VIVVNFLNHYPNFLVKTVMLTKYITNYKDVDYINKCLKPYIRHTDDNRFFSLFA
jgi:hypothetical protein